MNLFWVIVLVTQMNGREYLIPINNQGDFKTIQACETAMKDLIKRSREEPSSFTCVGRKKS